MAETIRVEVSSLIKGDSSVPVKDAVLIFEDGVITYSGRASDVPEDTSDKIIKYPGKTLMPMLINLHGHVGFLNYADTSYSADHYSRESILEELERHEYYGVGVVASLGTDIGDLVYQIRSEQQAGKVGGARLLVTGRGFVAPGGGPTIRPLSHTPYEVDNPNLARLLVQELARRKVDLIKLWEDDRNGRVPKLTPEISAAIIDEANKLGIKTIAHVYYLEDAKRLVRTGVSGFAHLVRDQVVDDELISLLLEHDVFVCPAINTHEGSIDWQHDPALHETLSIEARSLIGNASPGWLANKEAQLIIYRRMQESIKRMGDAGVRIVLGVDSGIPLHFAGFVEHWELQKYVEAGLSPQQAIITGTSTPAEVLGLDDLGSLVEGKRADFIVLDADPLIDIANTRKIHAVYRNGKEINRDEKKKSW